jgi:voltage-gated potassium channel
VEGRLLCLLLALYAVTIFGYVTAALASFFVDRDKAEKDSEEPSLRELQAEIQALRREIQALRGAR